MENSTKFKVIIGRKQKCPDFSLKCHFWLPLHYVPHIPSHGVHDEECPIPRQRGPAQRQRDRARAAAHRAKQQLLENGKPAATAGTESTGSDENPQQGQTPAQAVSASPQALPPPSVASAAGLPRPAAPAGTP